MDSIIIAFKTGMAIPLVRILFIAWCVLFLFICMLSIAIARVPSRRLYKAGADGAKKAPLDAIKQSYKENPEKWLLYEEEIFYVTDPDGLTGEDLEAYERARVRCVDGGKEARQVGSRIRVGRTETQEYLRFFYSLHKERKPKRVVEKKRRDKKAEPEFVEDERELSEEELAFRHGMANLMNGQADEAEEGSAPLDEAEDPDEGTEEDSVPVEGTEE